MSNLVFDIEANGLDPSEIFCIVAQDVDTMDVFTFDNTQLQEGYDMLASRSLGVLICLTRRL
jgi:hypothetical protein